MACWRRRCVEQSHTGPRGPAKGPRCKKIPQPPCQPADNHRPMSEPCRAWLRSVEPQMTHWCTGKKNTCLQLHVTRAQWFLCSNFVTADTDLPSFTTLPLQSNLWLWREWGLGRVSAQTQNYSSTLRNYDSEAKGSLPIDHGTSSTTKGQVTRLSESPSACTTSFPDERQKCQPSLTEAISA